MGKNLECAIFYHIFLRMSQKKVEKVKNQKNCWISPSSVVLWIHLWMYETYNETLLDVAGS